MHREMSQGSLAETLVSAKLGQNRRLERIDRAVAWDRLEELVEGVYSAKEGRPSYPPLMMVPDDGQGCCCWSSGTTSPTLRWKRP